MTQTARILVVEDEEIIAELIRLTLKEQGCLVTIMNDAETAWYALENGMNFDAILLDRGLPGMDGMSLLRRIKADAHLQKIPVIIETSLDDIDSVREGLSAGAYYYLVKPLHPPLLLAVVHAAVDQYRDITSVQAALHEAEQAMSYLEAGVFRFRTLAEARALAQGLAHACPAPRRVVLGLQELLINAVEHGNLGISYTDKTQLLIEDRWLEEIERREADPFYLARRVTVSLARNTGSLKFTIQDEGEGFSWEKYLELSPERAFDPHGRGIAMAKKISFNNIEYQGNGNTVTVTIDISPDTRNNSEESF